MATSSALGSSFLYGVVFSALAHSSGIFKGFHELNE